MSTKQKRFAVLGYSRLTSATDVAADGSRMVKWWSYPLTAEKLPGVGVDGPFGSVEEAIQGLRVELKPGWTLKLPPKRVGGGFLLEIRARVL